MALRVFGLTGGIGSGKSAVAQRLRARGLPVVNADELARVAVARGSVGLERVAEYFGTGVLTPEGELDRARLARIVFSDPEARRMLDSMIHPLVRQLAIERFRDIGELGEPLACYEVPLLFEAGLDRSYQPVLVVSAPLALREQRLAQRDGFNPAQIAARIAAQLPLEEKVRRADYVIDNAGTLEELAEATDAALTALCDALAVPVARYPRLPLS
ncbi:MAG TPA: dephospho-CoA kinase [Polyangiaceae bacterium]|nr:dephospho-CoA kinase [Polyangiaceae bacterium]